MSRIRGRATGAASAGVCARGDRQNVMQRLNLGEDRDLAIARTTAIVRQAWSEFDRGRDDEPDTNPGMRALLAAPLPETPTPVSATLDEAASILDHSLAQSRPRFLAYIGSSGLEVGAIADFLAASYDVNMAVDARAASLLERQTSRWLAEFIGYPHGDGLFTSGGMVSNLTALAAARERACPGVRESGLVSRMAAYCSADGHHSVLRALELLGLGRRSLRAIPLDAERRMRVDRLEKAILHDQAAGIRPMAVIATAGTTLTGAVDPLRGIGEVARRHGVWMHVDAAYGGPAAGTAEAAPLFDGLALADSVTIDAHKWLFVPKACSIVLVRDPATLTATFAHHEAYMPHDGAVPNPVDATLEYSRPLRALKLWLAFRTHGAAAIRGAIADTITLARLAYERARATAGFRTLDTPPQLSVVPLAHVPSGVTDVDDHQRRLCSAIGRDGRALLSSAVIDGRSWLRPCFTNFRTRQSDVDTLFDVIVEQSRLLGRQSASSRIRSTNIEARS